jgi:adenosylcobyric acid synthase
MPVKALKNSAAAGRCLAVLGTGSEVGKSVVATAICRVLFRRGVHVAPFKAQNMSNNSGVTAEGLEMGRAQIVQAEAAGIAPRVDMNPILLKPTSEVGSQVVVLGQVHANLTASAYHRRKPQLEQTARDALDRLRRQYQAVILEGAGSCAEVNLMAHDLVNLSMAAHAQASVVLVADIHKGGVFAQIVGTLACLAPEAAGRIAGFIVNRFRGDIALFADGVHWIQERTGRPVFGVLPWFSDFRIEAEDSVVIETPRAHKTSSGQGSRVVVVRLPHISNFTDFEPLQAISALGLTYLETPADLPSGAALILPGSKNTRADLAWLEARGWSAKIRAHAAAGGHVLGICGGYQMLGQAVDDPCGHEGPPGASAGLGLLPVRTVLQAPKTTTRTRFDWSGARGEGYEIHMGRTRRLGGAALMQVLARNGAACRAVDGCAGPEGRILGTYIHGLFDSPAVVRRYLSGLGLGHLAIDQTYGPAARDRAYERLADHFEAHVDVPALMALLGLRDEARHRAVRSSGEKG